MIVSSPIGELPFEPVRLTVRGGAVHLEGRMGAWPAQVEVTPHDAVSMARVLAVPLALVAATAAGGTALVRAARGRR